MGGGHLDRRLVPEVKIMDMFLNFFDEVYVLNLPHRTDRLDQMTEELNRHGIPFTVWSAVYNPGLGAHGLIDTMKSVLRHIVEKRQQNVIILEDDATFLINNPAAFLKAILPQVPRDYHLLMLGLNLLSRPVRMSENILKVIDSYSTHAIAYSLEGARIALERLEKVQPMPYDIFIRQELLPLMASYCTYPMMATQRKSYSDIEKGEPKWHELMIMSYNMHTKNMSYMAQEIAYCIETHQINGTTPAVDSGVFEIQNKDLVGKSCDCGRFVYDEDKCPTCNGDKWKIVWREK